MTAVFAWRVWGLTTAPGELSSFLAPEPGCVTWEPGWQRARCAFHDHPAPDDGDLCARCGWRGQPDLSTLVWWLGWKPATPHVIGRVELDGKILRGDPAHPEIPDVLRAGLARVAGPLLIGPGLGGHAQALAARYGADVRLSSAASLLRWPRTAVADLGIMPGPA